MRAERIRTGLYGRFLVDFTRLKWPQHKFSNGDIVGIFTSNIGQILFNGIVYKVSPEKITIAFDSFDVEAPNYGILMLANEVTHRKQINGIKNAMGLSAQSPSYRIKQVLLYEEPPRIVQQEINISPFNQRLNNSQIKAISFCLFNCQDLGIIHGPPGTGKTTTVVELIQQCVLQNLRVLCTAPSNIAVDNIIEKLDGKVQMCRIGHPARVMQNIGKYTFDSLVKKTDQAELSGNINQEINQLNQRLSRSTNKNDKYQIRQEMRHLRKELRERNNKAFKEVFENANVVLSTNVSAGSRDLENFAQSIGLFDVVIIDEAAQALEASCWIPAMLGKKLILAGDHQQLSPTIKSMEAANQGLNITLLDRMAQRYPDITKMLEIQYRMNEKIMQWSSQQFYCGRLIADESVKNHIIENYIDSPLLLIDTAGTNMGEGGDVSKFNTGEAGIVCVVVQELRQIGVKQIAVITQYNAQVELLRGKLPNIEISTVDGFQGRENDVIIISLVRSNPKFNIGFLTDYKRLNVAVTRARKLLVIVCDTDTIASEKSPGFLKSFVQYLNDNAVLRSSEEFDQVEYDQGMFSQAVEKGQKKKKVQIKQTQEVQDEFQEEKAVLQKLKKFVDQFTVCSQNEVYTQFLPGNLIAFVHQYADKLNLFHKTVGSRKKRRVYLSKKYVKVENDPKGPLFEIDTLEENEDQEEQAPIPTVSTKIVQIKQTNKDDDNIDEFLLNQKEINKKCSQRGCNTDIQYLKAHCRFCNKLYCFPHGIPEAHGCGNEARMDARQQIKKPQQLKPSERKFLEQRLKETKEKVARKRPQRKGKKK